jgi:hypothetical protein
LLAAPLWTINPGDGVQRDHAGVRGGGDRRTGIVSPAPIIAGLMVGVVIALSIQF